MSALLLKQRFEAEGKAEVKSQKSKVLWNGLFKDLKWRKSSEYNPFDFRLAVLV
ncbi:MAG: hypothetical protein V7L25_04405 [Nostoc sp.]